MNRIRKIEPATARNQARNLFLAVKGKWGFVPNSFRILANSPAVLRGFLGLKEALTGGILSPRQREQISLAVSEIHSCAYCLSAHTFMGQYAGMNHEEITDARLAMGSDEKSDAILTLARTIVIERGQLEEDALRAAREAGLSDEEIVEIVATVALATFTNYMNEIADTEIDYPEVRPRMFHEGLPVTVTA